MKSETFKELLKNKNACKEAIDWAEGKSLEEVWNTCHRGDWMLWLAGKTGWWSDRELSLAKGKCAETVIHLMKDERSRAAVKAAIDYGEGKISREELAAAAAAADADASYADAATANAAYAADAATANAVYDANAASYAAAADAADAATANAVYDANAASYAAAAAYAANRKITADICRSILKLKSANL